MSGLVWLMMSRRSGKARSWRMSSEGVGRPNTSPLDPISAPFLLSLSLKGANVHSTEFNSFQSDPEYFPFYQLFFSALLAEFNFFSVSRQKLFSRVHWHCRRDEYQHRLFLLSREALDFELSSDFSFQLSEKIVCMGNCERRSFFCLFLRLNENDVSSSKVRLLVI